MATTTDIAYRSKDPVLWIAYLWNQAKALAEMEGKALDVLTRHERIWIKPPWYTSSHHCLLLTYIQQVRDLKEDSDVALL
jgi:hypothetical protein